jgi:hypothetical protein
LQWKYAGTQKELTEVGQQKIYDVFAPTGEPEQKELSKGEKVARAVFTEIEIPEKNAKLSTVCSLWKPLGRWPSSLINTK